MILHKNQSKCIFSSSESTKISLKAKKWNDIALKANKSISFLTHNEQYTKNTSKISTKLMGQIAENDEILTTCSNNRRFCGLFGFVSLDLSKPQKAKQNSEKVNSKVQSVRHQFSIETSSKSTAQEKYSVSFKPLSKGNYIINPHDQINNSLCIKDRSSNFLKSRPTTSPQQISSLDENEPLLKNSNSKLSLKSFLSNKLVKKQLQSSCTQETNFKTSIHKQSEQGQAACLCLPQCFWIDRWQKLIKNDYDSQSRGIDPNIVALIEKDVNSTQHNAFFSEAKNKQKVKEVLVNYSRISPQTGYATGMNYVAQVIVYHSKNGAQSSAIFNLVMKQKEYQKVYQKGSSLSSRLAKELASQLKQYEPSIYSFLAKHGVELQGQVRSWYASMLGSVVPLESMHYVVDKFVKKGFRGINELTLSLLICLKEQILSFGHQENSPLLTAEWFRRHTQNLDWLQIVGFSENIPLNMVFV